MVHLVSHVPQVREEQMVRIGLYVYVCVAPPMIVGAWSMAIVLWQLYEYYYYSMVHAYYNILSVYIVLCTSFTCLCISEV